MPLVLNQFVAGAAVLIASFGVAAGQQTPAQPGVSVGTDDGKDPSVTRDVSNYNLNKDHLAIEGYDPVSYFPEGGSKPVKGVKEHEYKYRGVTYRFANQANHDSFAKNPRKYEPSHGGWCSSAIADSARKVEIDPENYKVTNGRLFLFYKGLLQDAKDYWNKDEKGNTKKADDNWKKISGEGPRVPEEKPAVETPKK